MNKPTQEELEITHKTLEFFLANIRDTEPYATNTINSLECLTQELPYDINDIEESLACLVQELPHKIEG
jgi:hypothetical protein